MKSLLYFSIIFIAFFSSLSFQSIDSKQITVVCKLTDCTVDSMSLFVFTGLTYKKVFVTKKETNGNFTFKINKPTTPKFYYLGYNENMLKPIIVGNDAEVNIEGSCQNIKSAVVKSNDFIQLNQVMSRLTNDKNEFGGYINEMRGAYSDTTMMSEIKQKMLVLDQKRLKFLDSLKKANPFLHKIAAINTYISYQPTNQKYADELTYFINEYMGQADLKDPAYNEIPQVFDQFSDFTQNLSGIGLPEEMQKSALDNYLSKMVEGSQSHRFALGGIVSRYIGSTNAANYIYYAEKYLKLYRNEELPAMNNMLENKIKSMRGLEIGGEAPDITLNTPDGVPLSLSSYRGKVVLIDFWASWCGPCRRENPHVVELYNKYKNKGFDVLGVSLDSNKEAWQAAIEKDGLAWKHISDLAGWSSSAAKLYGVTSIPRTFLLDKNGKIIAKNLRGQQLTDKLKEILGE